MDWHFRSTQFIFSSQAFDSKLTFDLFKIIVVVLFESLFSLFSLFIISFLLARTFFSISLSELERKFLT